jgi:hypothetical protein
LDKATIKGMPARILALGLARSPVLQHYFAKAMIDGGLEQACDMNDG